LRHIDVSASVAMPDWPLSSGISVGSTSVPGEKTLMVQRNSIN
jgi:hypothetical protein